MKKLFTRAAPLLLILLLWCQSVSAEHLLIPGGQLIGLALQDDSVTVASFDTAFGTAAKAAGLQVGDRITHVDGQPIRSAEEIRNLLARSDSTVRLGIVRSGKAKTLSLQPQITADGPRLGVYLKEGVTGIGTVTWYDPQTHRFGALGHGVNQPTGQLLQMKTGTVFQAEVLSVRKGLSGEPGQLLGSLSGNHPIGQLHRNTDRGIFGILDAPCFGEKLPVGTAADVRTGDAVILSTVCSGPVQEYSVEILKIYPNSLSSGRNLLLKVTDPDLLSATGGIVQGMSGSPLVQDGKLIGAVTHVLVNDPTMGYGIFIENMLEAAG